MAAKFPTCKSNHVSEKSLGTKNNLNQLRFKGEKCVGKDGLLFENDSSEITLALPMSTTTCHKKNAVSVEKTACCREERKANDEIFQSERKGANYTPACQNPSNKQKPPLASDNSRATRSQSCHVSSRADQECRQLFRNRSKTRGDLESVMVKQLNYEASGFHFLRKSNFVFEQPTTSSQLHRVELPPISSMASESYFVIPARKSKTRHTLSTQHSDNMAGPEVNSHQPFADGSPGAGQRSISLPNTQQRSGMSRAHTLRRRVGRSDLGDYTRIRQQRTENFPEMFDNQCLSPIENIRHLVTRSIREEGLNSSQQRPTNTKCLYLDVNAPVVSEKEGREDKQPVTRPMPDTRRRRCSPLKRSSQNSPSINMWFKEGTDDIMCRHSLSVDLPVETVNTEASCDSIEPCPQVCWLQAISQVSGEVIKVSMGDVDQEDKHRRLPSRESGTKWK